MNAIANIAQSLTGSPFTASKKAPTLAQCKAEMTKQINATQKGIQATFTAAISLGEAATLARDLCPSGKWLAWLKENFATKYTWVNVCMRAAAAWHLLEKQPESERLAVLEKFDTVEKFAGTLTVLDQGESPLVVEPVKRARAPNKLKVDNRPIDVESRDIPDTGKGANEAADIIKALDARSKALDAREAKLDKREKDLDAREAALALREAKPQAATKDTATAGEVALEKARIAARNKAAPKAPQAAVSAAKPEAKGKAAKTPKTAPTRVKASAPGKAALLSSTADDLIAKAKAIASAPVPNEPVDLASAAQAPKGDQPEVF